MLPVLPMRSRDGQIFVDWDIICRLGFILLMKFNRFLPLIISVLALALEEIYFFWPKFIYASAILTDLLIFFIVWQFSKASAIDKRWWNYWILPSLTAAALLSYSVFLENKPIIQLLLVFYAVFLYVYLRHVYYYLLKPLSYRVFSIENISSYSNWLTFFLFSSSAYGLASFLNAPIHWLVLIIISVAFLLSYQIIWVNKIDFKSSLPCILIHCLLLTELFWAISFLPLNYNISGLSLAICYYAMTGLFKNYLLNKLDQAKVRMYLILGGSGFLLLLITAKWI